jgi:fructose-bisphosphate aldolase, class I
MAESGAPAGGSVVDAAPSPSTGATVPRVASGPTAGRTHRRPSLDSLHLSPGKRTRLRRLLHDYGPGGGTMLVLPIDQGLEHGPVDFFSNPDALDPDYQFRLAREGKFSAIAVHIGLAQKYYPAPVGEIPLILKLNGKTGVPPDSQAFSALTGTVEDAVHLGAEAVGYTIYVGSPAQDRDFDQFHRVRADCDRYGMPLIVWAYPRGEAIAKRGGKESLYAVDYAARVALELGADIVKVNYPVASEKDKDSPAPYSTLQLSPEAAFHKVVQSAGRALVLVSGGEKVGDAELLTKVRSSMDAGATGIIFGRNLWQRPWAEALQLTRQLHGIFREYAEPLP